MPIDLPDDYWIDIPACTFTLGVTRDEARRFAEQAAAYKNSQLLPEMDAWQEVDEREQRSGNVEYLTERALYLGPARTVHIPAYSIARFPVTNALYRRFLDETGLDLEDAELTAGLASAEGAVKGRSWSEVEAFMAWSGYRVPFEDEWERAARGLRRAVFPWGDEFGAIGAELVAAAANRLPRDVATRAATFEGFIPYAGRGWEWCADIWGDDPPRANSDAWERTRARWSRILRGGLDYWEAASITQRGLGVTEAEHGQGDYFRLAKHNGRAVRVAPPMTGWSGAREKVRAFERTIAQPALESVKDELELHRVAIWTDDQYPKDLATYESILATSLAQSAGARVDNVSTSYFNEPTRPAYGIILGAVTLETFRRVASSEHGVFLWTLVYRLDTDENILAHPVAFYHMACDGQWHRFDDRFRAGEDDTPIGEITSAMIADHVREAFRVYDEYADADLPPPSGRRETRTPPLRIFR